MHHRNSTYFLASRSRIVVVVAAGRPRYYSSSYLQLPHLSIFEEDAREKSRRSACCGKESGGTYLPTFAFTAGRENTSLPWLRDWSYLRTRCTPTSLLSKALFTRALHRYFTNAASKIQVLYSPGTSPSCLQRHSCFGVNVSANPVTPQNLRNG